MSYEKCDPRTMMKMLSGSWTGSGSGSYPQIGEFEYSESITFKLSSKGFMTYTQSTMSTMGSPMHQEMGYLRPDIENSGIELVIAQPTGIAEILTGKVTSSGELFRFDLHSCSVVTTPSAKEVTKTGRYFHLSPEELSYELYMQAVGESYQLHLQTSLTRVPKS